VKNLILQDLIGPLKGVIETMARNDINIAAEIASIQKVDANLVFVSFPSVKEEHK